VEAAVIPYIALPLILFVVALAGCDELVDVERRNRIFPFAEIEFESLFVLHF